MDEHVRNIFLFEATKQAQFGLNAHTALRNVLPRLLTPAEPLAYDKRQTLHSEVFRTVHSLLTHASNVSRLFWPTPPRRNRVDTAATYSAKLLTHTPSVRASVLRSAAGLEEAHSLRDRQLRNHLEHFDERLDRWAESSVAHNFVQDMIGGSNGLSGIAQGDSMRWYDPSRNTMRFHGHEYPLGAIVGGLVDVHDRCVRVLSASSFASALREIEPQQG